MGKYRAPKVYHFVCKNERIQGGNLVFRMWGLFFVFAGDFFVCGGRCPQGFIFSSFFFLFFFSFFLPFFFLLFFFFLSFFVLVLFLFFAFPCFIGNFGLLLVDENGYKFSFRRRRSHARGVWRNFCFLKQ